MSLDASTACDIIVNTRLLIAFGTAFYAILLIQHHDVEATLIKCSVNVECRVECYPESWGTEKCAQMQMQDLRHFLLVIYVILRMKIDLTHLFAHSSVRNTTGIFSPSNLSNKSACTKCRCKRTIFHTNCERLKFSTIANALTKYCNIR